MKQPAKIREPLTAKQHAAKLAFQRLDRIGDRRLRHVAVARGATKIQLLRDREEISDLLQFHVPCAVSSDVGTSVALRKTTEPDGAGFAGGDHAAVTTI